MITIDGSRGEGGGQVLRSSLALSLVTGKPFRIENIRGKRKKPGLMRQHLTAVRAASAIGNASVSGADIGGAALVFEPGGITPGEYTFSVGTAGSATLVLQTVLPALVVAKGSSRLVIEGGTHNPFAPPFDFLEKAFLPCLCKMGPNVSCHLERHGFYPAGGGRFVVDIQPVEHLMPLELLCRGDLMDRRVTALVSGLPVSIGHREVGVVEKQMGWESRHSSVHSVEHPMGPGNALIIEVAHRHITEVFTGVGEQEVPAEKVARAAVAELRKYLDSCVPVGRHLADQLLIPMAMAGGAFRTLKPTNHTITNAFVIKQFMDIGIDCRKIDDAWEITVSKSKNGNEQQ